MKALVCPQKTRKARKHPNRVQTVDYDLTPVASTGVQALLALAGKACTPAVFSFPRATWERGVNAESSLILSSGNGASQ